MNLKKLPLIFCLIFLFACSSKKPEYPLPAPYSRIHLLNGDYVSLASVRGPTTVIAFWASWCSKSRYRIEKLNQIAADYSKTNYTFIAVSLDEEDDLQELKEFIEGKQINNLIHAFSGNAGADETFSMYRYRDEIPQFLVIRNNQIIAADDDVEFLQSAL